MKTSTTISIIPVEHLALAFIPVLVVLGVFYWWSLKTGNVFYAFFRMLLQLMLVGYALLWVFAVEHAWIVLLIALGMAVVSTWIALRTISQHRRKLYSLTLLAILLGGGCVLLLITQLVLELDPWYQPNSFIPLAGMIFSNSMNGVSLAADRLQSEWVNLTAPNKLDYTKARANALNTSLIPLVNSLFAVGLVALPGMMTGQILSGVSPLVATRYQIMVMCMLFGASGLSTIIFLWFNQRYFQSIRGAEAKT